MNARIPTIMDEWCVNDNSFTILNYWSQQWYQYQHSWPSGVTNDSKFYNIHRLEDYSHEYLRLWMSGFFNDQRFTILNKWSQHWSMYQSFLQSGVNNNSKLYNMYWVRGLHARNLLLWMSDVFNDQRFTILNRWSQQWCLYQNSRQSGVNNDSKFYNIYSVRVLQARIPTIMDECCLQWQQLYHFECVESTIKAVSTFSTEWSH